MTQRTVITPEEGTELQHLYDALPAATKSAVQALTTNGAALEGAALDRFKDEVAKVKAITQRINEILGLERSQD